MTDTNFTPSTIKLEDLMLRHDRRGISALRPYLPADNYMQTAAFALQHKARVLIVTGFYVNGTAETDGPPGALALADGFMQLGSRVTIVTDRYCLPILESAHPGCSLVEFPIASPEDSRHFAQKIFSCLQPTLLISVERCGITRDGFYRNMRSLDITPYTARLDELFAGSKSFPDMPGIGIGDGGNEIGMGLLYEQLLKLPNLVSQPAVTATTRLLISTVSNWAAYGLLAAMSITGGKLLLPDVKQQHELLHNLVLHGAIDGVCGEKKPMVDGFDEEVNDAILEDLHRLVRHEITAG